RSMRRCRPRCSRPSSWGGCSASPARASSARRPSTWRRAWRASSEGGPVLRIGLAGQDALLHPSGALYLSSAATLLVADAHFGKAVSFRKLGVPVPHGTTLANLARLEQAMTDTGARRVVFL